jgi:hypothetical protein
MADVIRLDVHALNLASFDHEGVTLASVSAKESSGRELQIESAGEGTAGVTEEADTATLVSIERLAPSGGPGWLLGFWIAVCVRHKGHTRRDR